MTILSATILFLCLTMNNSIVFAGDHLSESLRLPDDLKIIAPSENIPPDIKELSGVWEAIWKNERAICYAGKEHQRRAAIIVDEIKDPAKAKVVYSWGRSPSQTSDPGWGRYEATIINQDDSIVMKIELRGRRSGHVLTFRKPKGQHVLLASDYSWEAEFRPSSLKNLK